MFLKKAVSTRGNIGKVGGTGADIRLDGKQGQGRGNTQKIHMVERCV
jgi:hypothetical protein